MENLHSYSGMTTKIRAMKRKLISPEEFNTIASLNSTSEAIAYLKKHPGYQEVLAPYDEELTHRQEIEKVLTKSIYTDFTKLYRFGNLDQRKYLNFYFKRYEINILKTYLRMVFDHREPDVDLTIFQDFFSHHSDVDISRLSSSHSLSEFVTNLKGSEYYGPLHQLERLESPTLFDYEMALDLYYFRTIWKKKNKVLKGQELKIITQDQGSKFDILNILWIYRAKKYYKMSNADIYAFLIPVTYRLNKGDITALTEAGSHEDFLSALSNTYYAKHYHMLPEDITSPSSLEAFYSKVRSSLHQFHARRYPYSVAMINSYFYEKEHEVDKLTTLLEALRYDVSASDIATYIIK